AIIFQNPRQGLNPIRTVGRHLEDVLDRHAALPRKELKRRALAALAEVEITDPERRYGAYPFELSGGMCQRVMIAMALACRPALMIADEPTTGLDVTTQAAVMSLIRELSEETQMAMMLITHDLSLAGESCDRIAVMHAGHVVETAPAAELFRKPRHPYTAGLIRASTHALAPIPGVIPDLRSELPICRFLQRCRRTGPECREAFEPIEVGPRHVVSCARPL
ncbi:MAG: ABC transporter ATP-binding protein, partial [Pseudomonadota bacterium]